MWNDHNVLEEKCARQELRRIDNFGLDCHDLNKINGSYYTKLLWFELGWMYDIELNHIDRDYDC